jgi:hypothetical protein
LAHQGAGCAVEEVGRTEIGKVTFASVPGTEGDNRLMSPKAEAISKTTPRYDVAISFLARDEPIAAALAARLTGGLNVFFYPRNQEDLAGTDGLESMRSPFQTESRINVVLFRDAWGETHGHASRRLRSKILVLSAVGRRYFL